MKILMFNNEFPPLGGGTGTVNREIFLQFAGREDIQIDLITSEIGSQKTVEQFAPNIRIFKYPVNNKDIHHSSNKELMSYAWQSFWAGWKMIRKEKYDLCMLWSTLPGGLGVWALKKLTGIPYIVRVTGPDIPGFETRYEGVYKLVSPVIRRAWRNAEVVIGKCQQEIDMILKNETRVKLKTIYNGIDAEKFQPVYKSREAAEPLKLLCVARLIQRKGQHMLIQAAQKLKANNIPIHIKLVGNGDEEEAYRQLTKELGVEAEIEFAGYVPREEIASVYAWADAFCLPSYNEGMSNAVLEAMAAGLPVIVTPTGGTEELVNHGLNGFVFDFDDIEALASQIQDLAVDSAKCLEMGKAARARAEQQDWGAIAGEYEGLFSSLIQKQEVPLIKPV